MVFFVLAYWFMYVSCVLLLKCSRFTKKKDYSKISLELLGKLGLITHLSVFINNFGMSIAFLIVGVDTFRTMLDHGFDEKDGGAGNWYSDRTVILSVFGVMIFPFLFIRSTKGMKFASRIVFLSHVAFATVIIVFLTLKIFKSITLNFILFLMYHDGKDNFTKDEFDWLPNWIKKFNPDDFKKALGYFPIVWLAFSF